MDNQINNSTPTPTPTPVQTQTPPPATTPPTTPPPTTSVSTPPAEAGSNSNSVIPEKKSGGIKSKFPLILVVVLLLIILVAGGVFFWKNMMTNDEPAPVVEETSIAEEVTPEPTPVSSPSADMSDWKTYTNTQFSFQYPSEYSVKQSTEGVTLEKSTSYIKGGGMGGSDVLDKGNVIGFTIWPEKDLSETELKSDYGSESVITDTTLGGKGVTKVELQDGSVRYFYDYSPKVLEISNTSGSSAAENELNSYRDEYDQILTTLKIN